MFSRIHQAITAALGCLLLLAITAWGQEAATEFPSGPIGNTVAEETQEIRPGITLVRRTTDLPLRIYALVIDLSRPQVSLEVCLARDSTNGTESVRSMADRKGAIAAINGDYWTYGGVPLNLTIVNGRIAVAPKHRTTFAVTTDGEPMIDIFTANWSWDTEIVAPNGESHWIHLLNSDCNPGWMCLYNGFWGKESRGDGVRPVTELVVDKDNKVLELRVDQPGIPIPEGGYILTGRDEAGAWLSANFKPGDTATLDIKTTRPIDNLAQAIGAGPRTLRDGEFVQDPIAEHPEGEEFALDWKRNHYLHRHPRSGLGLSADRKTLILVVVDGRQSEWSLGVYQRQMAEILRDFGAADAMDLDSGGSSTLYVEGEVLNKVSDRSKPDGTGGVERRVANALLVFYNDPEQSTETSP